MLGWSYSGHSCTSRLASFTSPCAPAETGVVNIPKRNAITSHFRMNASEFSLAYLTMLAKAEALLKCTMWIEESHIYRLGAPWFGDCTRARINCQQV